MSQRFNLHQDYLGGFMKRILYVLSLLVFGLNASANTTETIEHQNCIIPYYSLTLNNQDQFGKYGFTDRENQSTVEMIEVLKDKGYQILTNDESKTLFEGPDAPKQHLILNIHTMLETTFSQTQRMQDGSILGKITDTATDVLEATIHTIVPLFTDISKEVSYRLTAHGVKYTKRNESKTTMVKRVNLAREAKIWQKMSELHEESDTLEDEISMFRENLKSTNDSEMEKDLEEKIAKKELELATVMMASKSLLHLYHKLNKNVYATKIKDETSSITLNQKTIAEGEESFFFKSTAANSDFVIDFAKRNIPSCVVNENANYDEVVYE